MLVLSQDDACTMVRPPVQVSINPFILFSLHRLKTTQHTKNKVCYSDVTLKFSGSQSHPKLIGNS